MASCALADMAHPFLVQNRVVCAFMAVTKSGGSVCQVQVGDGGHMVEQIIFMIDQIKSH